jgi:hypothetical protein
MIHTKQVHWEFSVNGSIEIKHTSVAGIFGFLKLIRQKPQHARCVRI